MICAEGDDGDDFRKLCDRLVELCEPEPRADPEPGAPTGRAAPEGGAAP